MLGSATPSMESYRTAQTRENTALLELPERAETSQDACRMRVVDMRESARKGGGIPNLLPQAQRGDYLSAWSAASRRFSS